MCVGRQRYRIFADCGDIVRKMGSGILINSEKYALERPSYSKDISTQTSQKLPARRTDSQKFSYIARAPVIYSNGISTLTFEKFSAR